MLRCLSGGNGQAEEAKLTLSGAIHFLNISCNLRCLSCLSENNGESVSGGASPAIGITDTKQLSGMQLLVTLNSLPFKQVSMIDTETSIFWGFFSCLVSRGRCGREVAWLLWLAAVVVVSVLDFEGDYDFFSAGEAKNLAISATEWLRARSRPPWSLPFCDASFVPLGSQGDCRTFHFVKFEGHHCYWFFMFANDVCRVHLGSGKSLAWGKPKVPPFFRIPSFP